MLKLRAFRGLIAPASLKRTNGPAAGTAGGNLPGPNRPGLIEAEMALAGSDGHGAFRGLIAPASLKQASRACLW